MFTLTKLQQLVTFKNPSIATFDQEIEAGPDNSFQLDQDGFMMAFGIDTYGGGTKNDERYLKWIARYKVVDRLGQSKFRYVPVRNCSEADFEKME